MHFKASKAHFSNFLATSIPIFVAALNKLACYFPTIVDMEGNSFILYSGFLHEIYQLHDEENCT